MATLAQLGDRARRKMNLGLGSHTVTVSDYANIAADATVTVHGITLIHKAANTTEYADWKAETSNNATAQNIDDLIGNIFDSTTGVTVAVSGAVVTITGARSVTSSDSTRLAVSSSTYQDEPPYTSDFDQWILDGQLDVADKVVNEALIAGDSGLSEEFSLTGDGASTGLALPTNFYRAIEVTAKIGSDSALYWLKRVDTDDMIRIRAGLHPLFKVKAADKALKYWALYDDSIQFSAAPTAGAGMAKILGIKTPQTTKTGTNVWTITVTDAFMVANDTITIDGIEMIVKAVATTEVADFIAQGTDDGSAQNLFDVIGNIFKPASGVQVSVAANIVTVTGARSITTTKAAAFAIVQTTAAMCELPSHLHAYVEDFAVIQAYRQMQRIDLSEPLLQAYMGNLNVINQRYQTSQETLK